VKRELVYPLDYEVDATGLCLASSMGTIYSALVPDRKIRSDRLAQAFPELNDIDVVNLFDLIEHYDKNDLRYRLIEIADDNPRQFLDLITRALHCGALVELGVMSNKWLEAIGEKGRLSGAHSIVVVGTYQPYGQKLNQAWFYVADPYRDCFLFLPARKIFSVQEHGRGLIWMSMFYPKNVSLDPKVAEETIGGNLENKRTRQKIRRRLQKEKGSKRSPFAWLFSKE